MSHPLWVRDLKILNTVIAHTNLSSPSAAHCVFLAWEQKTLSFLKDRLAINWKLIWSIPSWLILRGRKANFLSQPFESVVGSGLRKVFSLSLTRAEILHKNSSCTFLHRSEGHGTRGAAGHVDRIHGLVKLRY